MRSWAGLTIYPAGDEDAALPTVPQQRLAGRSSPLGLRIIISKLKTLDTAIGAEDSCSRRQRKSSTFTGCNLLFEKQ